MIFPVLFYSLFQDFPRYGRGRKGTHGKTEERGKHYGGGVIDDKGKTQKLTRLLRPVSVGMFYLVGQFVAPKHRFFSFLL